MAVLNAHGLEAPCYAMKIKHSCKLMYLLTTIFSQLIVFSHRQLNVVQYLTKKTATKFLVMYGDDSGAPVGMTKK